MFEYEKTIRKFEKFDELPKRKQRKMLRGLITDTDFMNWLFNPQKSSQQMTAPMIDEFYKHMTRPLVMRVLCDTIEDEGYEAFTRDQAMLLYTTANIALEINNERAEATAKERKAGTLTSRDAREFEEKIDKYSDDISRVLKTARRIIKRDVKDLADETNLDKEICYQGYWNVPSIDYLDKYKVGTFLNNLLNIVYGECARAGFNRRKTIRWRPFFKEIFGSQNLANVSTFILLEGVHRISSYKNTAGAQAVRDCWDSLTEFALKELDSASDDTRTQMMELYIKRIDRMFKNNSFDLRVNLLNLPKEFRNLINTVSHYSNKIMSILNRTDKPAEPLLKDPDIK